MIRRPLRTKDRIASRPGFTIATLLYLHSCQTADEREVGATVHQNDKGFNALDAAILSSMAEFYTGRGYLTPKQLDLCQRKLVKYHNQVPCTLKSLPNGEPPTRKTVTAEPKVCRLVDGKLWITFPYDSKLVGDIKRTLHSRGFKSGPNGEGKRWEAALSLENVMALEALDFPLAPEVRAWYESKTAPAPDHIDVPGLGGTLRPFQTSGVAYIESRNGRALIGDEMGLGKTVQALAWLQLHPELRPAILVVPASLKLNWAREAVKWMDNPEVEILKSQKPYFVNGDIVIINYHILTHWQKKLRKLKPAVVVFDEVHYAKNPKTLRSKACLALSKAAPHCLALSGTPITNRPIEFFNPIQLVDPTLYPDFWAFAHKYCNAKHNGRGWDFTGATNKKELHAKLTSTIMLRRLKVEVAKELPPKTRVVVPMEITNRKEYARAQIDLIRWIQKNQGQKKADAASSAEALVRIEVLKQLCYKGKTKAAIQWIEDFLESGEKLVVFATHKKTIRDLKEVFGDIAVVLDGSTAPGKRQGVVDSFQNDPKIRLFLGNLKAAGVGITLTAASATCFLELGWTPGEHDQAEDRVHRIGQLADAVTAYYLLAFQTIEEEIAELIDKKRAVLAAVLDGKDVKSSSLLGDLLRGYAKMSVEG
jgi:SNF2 family DNA or RNA helicase